MAKHYPTKELFAMTNSSGNVFADLGFSAGEAQNLLLCSQSMSALKDWYEASGLTKHRPPRRWA
jgi:predicted XRE-type DNA-binding protein